jgi:hypothetical protein
MDEPPADRHPRQYGGQRKDGQRQRSTASCSAHVRTKPVSRNRPGVTRSLIGRRCPSSIQACGNGAPGRVPG